MAAVDWLPASEYPFEPASSRSDLPPVGLSFSAQTFAWPLREYPWIRRALRFVSGSLSRFANGNFNLMFAPARVVRSGSSSLSGRWRTFLVPWRRHAALMMTLRNLGRALTADAWLDEVAHAIDTTH